MITYRLKGRSCPSRGDEPHTISACPRLPAWKKILLGAGLLMLLTVVTVAGVFIHFYLQFARIIDARLDGSVFGNPAVILAAPSELQVGQPLTAGAVTAHLRKASYAKGQEGRGVGSYTVTGEGLDLSLSRYVIIVSPVESPPQTPTIPAGLYSWLAQTIF